MKLSAVLTLCGLLAVSGLSVSLAQAASTDDVASVLARLDERELVRLLPRQPGQREERWGHLLADERTPEGPAPTAQRATVDQRLAQIEDRLAELERRLDER